MVIKTYGDESLPKIIALHHMLAEGACKVQLAGMLI